MVGRSIFVVAGLFAALAPAAAGELRPEEAKKFIAGKYFSYTCFDGTSGAGRIDADGSVVGTMQPRGAPRSRVIALPSGTIRVQPDSICASVRGMPFEPCFTIVQTDPNSFRGSLSPPFTFAYCDFTRRNPPRPASRGMLRTSNE